MRFEIIHYRDNDPRVDAGISGLLRAVYVDAGFTPPAVVPIAFASEEIKKRGKIFLALDSEKDVIGMIIVGTAGNPYKQVATADEAEMQLLGVLPPARGHGIAEALCRRFETQALADGFQKAVLSTQPMMAAAHKLYGKLDYARNPSRDWEKSGRAFWVYEKPLTPSPSPGGRGEQD